MTRIIAGEFGGRRLKVPDEGTRPTTDRVREALFSIIGARVDLDELDVLDLYAGSGALGLEALSRGARTVTFVDDRRRASSIIAANLATVGATARGRVITGPVAGYLAGSPTERVGLVLTDPPYALDSTTVTEDLRRIAADWLADGGLVALERDARSAPVEWPESMTVIVDKTYGDTRIQVGYRSSDDPSEGE
ncbi:16S rRNA (guanine(966)-N(2))-methyltransferase RsmD [Gordonia sinesedis]